MLFGFYILVFININYAGINCFALRQNELDVENVTNPTDTSDIADFITPNNATTRHFYKMIQNLTSTKSNFSNLKSNLFDKMLSNEMLSIKEHLFEKDLSQVSILLSTNANAPTPTLEIKQKWSFVENKFSNENREKNNTINNLRNSSNGEQTNDDDNGTDNDSGDGQHLNKKVLGLRSLSLESHPHGIYHRTPLRSSSKNESNSSKSVKCTCIKNNNPSVACNHHSDGSCKCGKNNPKACTRLFQTVFPTVTVPMYMTYQTFLLEISTYSPYRDYFYHPNVLDDLKLPKKHKKKKHKHKTTKRFDEDSLYYDNSKEGFFKGYDDKYDDDYLENTKKSTINHDDNKLIIDIDYEIRDDKGKISKTTLNWENGYIKDVIKEKLVNDMVKDLKQQYADAVLQDCYCSAYSLHLNFIQNHLLLIALALFWLLNKLYYQMHFVS